MLAKMLLRKAAGMPTLSFNTSATSTSNTITIPAGAAVGDIAILRDCASTNYSIPSTVVPSGWTSVSNLTGTSQTGDVRIIVSYKKLLAGDPGSTITGMNGALYNYKTVIILSPSLPISTIAVAGLDETIGDSAPSARNVAAQTLNYVVIGCASTHAYSPSWTTSWYDQTVANNRTSLAFKIFNSSPASVSMDFTAGGYAYACIQAFALVVT